MKREALIQSQIIKHYKSEGWIVINIPGNIYANRGFPDLMLLKDGQAMFIEVKRPGGRVAPLQWEWIRRLRKAGFKAGVALSLQDALNIERCE